MTEKSNQRKMKEMKERKGKGKKEKEEHGEMTVSKDAGAASHA